MANGRCTSMGTNHNDAPARCFSTASCWSPTGGQVKVPPIPNAPAGVDAGNDVAFAQRDLQKPKLERGWR
jgi:hypothetical protein